MSENTGKLGKIEEIFLSYPPKGGRLSTALLWDGYVNWALSKLWCRNVQIDLLHK